MEITEENCHQFALSDSYENFGQYFQPMKKLLVEEIKASIQQEIDLRKDKPCLFLNTESQQSAFHDDTGKGTVLVLKLISDSSKNL